MFRILLACWLTFLTSHCCRAEGPSPSVHTARVPHDGIQPQVAVGSDGTIHLVYFSGEPATGDIYYVTSTTASGKWSAPQRVNSQPGSAVAVGTIRGPQLALGKNNSIHVVWNGSGKATPKGLPNPQLPEDSPYRFSAPLLYSQFDREAQSFSPQRNLMTCTYALDGGGSIAADVESDYVYAVWHANSVTGASGEGHRAVWAAISADGGKTFAAERRINSTPTGACGCCSLRAYCANGKVHVLYRSATHSVDRDMYLLTSRDFGQSFMSQKLDSWEVDQCVMSSSAFAHRGETLVAAWETQHQIKFADLSEQSDTRNLPLPVWVPTQAKSCKHPVACINSKGQVLVAWTEGTGWQKGGAVAWELFDGNGRSIPNGAGRADGVPTWSTVSVVVADDDSFTVIY